MEGPGVSGTQIWGVELGERQVMFLFIGFIRILEQERAETKSQIQIPHHQMERSLVTRSCKYLIHVFVIYLFRGSENPLYRRI